MSGYNDSYDDNARRGDQYAGRPGEGFGAQGGYGVGGGLGGPQGGLGGDAGEGRYAGGEQQRQEHGQVDPREYGGGGRGEDNYYTSSSNFEGSNPVRDHQQSGHAGGNYGGNDDIDGAMEHAERHIGSSGDSSLFSQALSFLKNKQSGGNDDIDEGEAVNAHKKLYGSDGSEGQQHSSQTMGMGAAMQALKMFSGGKSSGSSKQEFIGMAMAQASKLFDEQSSQGKVSPSASKQSAINSAAEMALKMYMKSQGGSSSGGSGMGGLMSIATKFL
ncbi:MAG: hypothetical protein M1834_002806 [Cirrosporium novae-zelandiae]|nr:MAG: hypothetical protein M1834_002806 [Cirrosporium novae-zelandiae]